MSAHTPGPWWEERTRIVATIWEGHAGTIGDAWSLGEVSGTRTVPLPSKANARLMAAAPQLLKALQDLADRVAVLAAHGRAPAINELELEKAVAVLAKARGEGKP